MSEIMPDGWLPLSVIVIVTYSLHDTTAVWQTYRCRRVTYSLHDTTAVWQTYRCTLVTYSLHDTTAAGMLVCDQAEDEAVDPRKLLEQRQKLLNDIERLRAENDSLKVSFDVLVRVCVCLCVKIKHVVLCHCPAWTSHVAALETKHAGCAAEQGCCWLAVWHVLQSLHSYNEALCRCASDSV